MPPFNAGKMRTTPVLLQTERFSKIGGRGDEHQIHSCYHKTATGFNVIMVLVFFSTSAVVKRANSAI